MTVTSGYGGKQLLGNVILGSGVPVKAGSQYLSRRLEQTGLSKPQSNPSSQCWSVIRQFVIYARMLGTTIAVYSAVIVGTFHVVLVLLPKGVPCVEPGTQEPSGQVQELLKVAVGAKT
jgi:hypothetical protein